MLRAAPPQKQSRLEPWDADHYEVRRVAARFGVPEWDVWRAPASAVTLAFAGVLEDEYADRVEARRDRLDAAYLTSAIHTAKPMEILGREQREVEDLMWEHPPAAAYIADAARRGLLLPLPDEGVR